MNGNRKQISPRSQKGKTILTKSKKQFSKSEMKQLKTKSERDQVMKTINFKKENRSIRFENVLLRSGAVIVSVVLLSFTVSAQGLWKQILTYNSFGKTAMLMVNASEASNETEVSDAGRKAPAPSKTISFTIEPAADQLLQVEAWMTDDAYFGAYNHLLRVEQDKPLELEGWMLNDHYFSSRITKDQDKDLNIEAWMLDKRFWRY